MKKDGSLAIINFHVDITWSWSNIWNQELINKLTSNIFIWFIKDESITDSTYVQEFVPNE